MNELSVFALLRCVDYYGFSARSFEDLYERFEEHCKTMRASLTTHKMLVFATFTGANCAPFELPEYAALAYEMLLSRFRKGFDIPPSVCQPGIGSRGLHAELMKTIKRDENECGIQDKHVNMMYDRLIAILRNPEPYIVPEVKLPVKGI